MSDTLTTCRYPTNAPDTGYKYGCRCDRCVQHHRAYNRDYHRRNTNRRGNPRHTVRRPWTDRDGYLLWYIPDHPLARQNGTVPAHRWVLHYLHDGQLPPACEHCAHPFTTWHDIEAHHIDHDKTNNHPTNIAALCRSCNATEGLHHRHGRTP